MDVWRDSYPLIVSCAKGLVAATADELRKLGYAIVDQTENMVVVRGNMRDMMELNLQLRTAHRVLVPLLRKHCGNLRFLYQDVYSIDWENLLEQDGYFTVRNVTRNRTVRDTRMPSLVTKDAIVDRIRDKCGGRPDVGNQYHGATIFVYWVNEELIVYLDTTGEPLSKRGYRKLPGTAPMQETLAAGCVLSSGWDGMTPFVAPMCGSGTPAIEAALIALNRAPGSFKSHFGFMALKGYRQMIPGERAGQSVRQRFGATPEQIWKERVMATRREERRENLPPIIATDISEESIENARLNAIAAGVSEYITFEACDFSATPLPEPPGVIFMNPPYGARLMAENVPQKGEGEASVSVPVAEVVEPTTEEAPPTTDELPEVAAAEAEAVSALDLEAFYQKIGDFLKQRGIGYIGAVLTGNMELSHKVGLRAKRRILFYNGSIECRLLLYDLYRLPAGGEKDEES